MTVNTASGTRVFIGSTVIPANMEDIDDAAALALFEADSYTEINEVENLGAYGDESTTVPFASLKDARNRKYKGTRDAGDAELVVGADDEDDGQQSLIAAEKEKFDYNIKVINNDAITLGGNGSIDYFYAKVMSARKTVGDVNNVVRRNFTLGINSRTVTVPAT